MLDLRKLFDKYRVEWRDKGPNCGRGQVNIACPLCGNDPSFHMAINEVSGEYYCFRNPKHAGGSVGWLLKALKLPVAAYSGLNLADIPRVKTSDTQVKDYIAFQYFTPAHENEEALNYLESRLFQKPQEVCQQFNLKISCEGEWAGRLIIPLTIGWTGRAMRDHINLRYKAYTSSEGFFLHKQGNTSCVIVEGALDAMRIASVTTQFDAIAKCRMALSPSILSYLLEARYISIFNCPDSTVPFIQAQSETKIIQSYCTQSEVSKLMLPVGVKDFGDTTEADTRELLSRVGNRHMII